jgi:hypothetical protein
MPKYNGSAISGAIVAIFLSIMAWDARAQEELPPPDVKYVPPEIKIDPASKARIKFEQDIFDFGSIPRGATVVHEFKFHNVGQGLLEVTDVRPTCGCTTAPLSSNNIAPGESATIKAYFNSEKFNGRVKKEIYVNTNDPINPYLKVSFTATINDPVLPVTVSPNLADFGSLKSGTSGQAKVAVTNNDGDPLDIAIIEQSAPGVVTAKIESGTLKPNESAELVLRLAPQEQAGELKESITFDIKGSQAARFTLPWRAVITE